MSTDDDSGPDTPQRHRHSLPHGAFGGDRFGLAAERFARLRTPGFLLGQTLLVAVWIALNGLAAGLRWDPYPFILLNLLFSTQAAYAAPLILLAQTRQADRDRAQAELDEHHRDALAERYNHFSRTTSSSPATWPS
jgi:uncharacterized membrane protein